MINKMKRMRTLYTSKSIGRDSSLDSDVHSNAPGVFGVICKFFCLDTSMGVCIAP